MADFKKNVAKDPTRTIVLRRQFIAAMNARFRFLKNEIKKVIVDENFLVAEKQEIKTPVVMADVFEYRWAEEKAREFRIWLDRMVELKILETFMVPVTRISPSIGEEYWTDTFIRSAYQRGLSKANSEFAGMDVTKISELGGLMAVFTMPIHAERAGLIYSRVFTDLKGVTDAMSAQMSRTLALGMAEGLSPETVARNLIDRVDKIGLTRARLIARTEIVHAHNLGKLNEYERIEVGLNEKISVRWLTALDEKVRDTHRPRHNKIYERKKAQALLGEPNCRCTIIPYVRSLEETMVDFGRPD